MCASMFEWPHLLHHPPQCVNVSDPPADTHHPELRPLWISSLHGRNHVQHLLLSFWVERPCKVTCGHTWTQKHRIKADSHQDQRYTWGFYPYITTSECSTQGKKIKTHTPKTHLNVSNKHTYTHTYFRIWNLFDNSKPQVMFLGLPT